MALTRTDLRAFGPGRALRRRVVCLPDRDAVYVKVPKAGCSTITLWLHRTHTGDHDSRPEHIHSENALPSVTDIGWPRALEMLGGAAFRFTFVRDPFTRAESAYQSKVVVMRRGRHWRRLRAALHPPGAGSDPAHADDARAPSFEEFLDAVAASDPVGLDQHFRPQHLLVMWGVVEYDLVGRLETFDADLARVRDRLGAGTAPLEVPNARPRSQSVYEGRPDLRRRVAELYAGDFEAFGYPTVPGRRTWAVP